MTTPTHPNDGLLHPHWKDASVPDGYTVVTVGDIIMEHPLREAMQRKPECQTILQWLADADLTVGNFEGTIIDLRRFKGYPEAQSGFGWLMSTPDCADDLKAMGFDMLSRANNHSLDWGVEGMHMTDEILERTGFGIAGTGSSMSAARAPGYVSGTKARAGMVSFTSTFEPNVPATDALGQVNARPGASTLGTTAVAMVSPERYAALKDVRDNTLKGMFPQVLLDAENRLGVISLFGKTYKAYPEGAPDQGVVRNHYTMDEQDANNVLLNLRQAKQTSDFTVLAAHTHEPSNWINTPPNFMPELARIAIAACGTSMVSCHGPHQLRGIEIFQGKPIFYSLANFAFMENVRAIVTRDEWERRVWKLLGNIPDLNPNTMTAAEFMEWQRVNGVFPDALWFESVMARTTYNAQGLAKRIELLPIELGWAGRDSERGLPRRAVGVHGKAILDRLAALSTPMGTRIEVTADQQGDFVGVIQPEETSP